MALARRRFAGPRRARGRRPGGTWSRGLNVTTVASAVKAVHTSFNLSTPGIGETLRRVRGWASAISDTVAASEAYLGAMGIAIVSDTALALGITALPGPFTDINDDIWLFWMGFGGNVTLLDSTGVVVQPPYIQLIDNRAMRRVEEGQAVVVMVENAQSTGMIFRSALSLYASRN